MLCMFSMLCSNIALTDFGLQTIVGKYNMKETDLEGALSNCIACLRYQSCIHICSRWNSKHTDQLKLPAELIKWKHDV